MVLGAISSYAVEYGPIATTPVASYFVCGGPFPWEGPADQCNNINCKDSMGNLVTYIWTGKFCEVNTKVQPPESYPEDGETGQSLN